MAGMVSYIVKRVLGLIPTVLLLLTFIFFVVEIIPGDAAMIALGLEMGMEQIKALRHIMGLDVPPHIRYFRWLSDLLRGDLGVSIRTRDPVSEIVSRALPITTTLALSSLIIALMVAIPAGILAATRRNTKTDVAVSAFALLGLSIPEFWSSLMLILFFAVWWPIFPSGGYVNPLINPIEGIKRLILPSAVLGLQGVASIARMTRSSLLEVLRQDYIMTARAKGLSERVVIYKHALKNALIPVTTIVGLFVGYLLGGAVIIERIFLFPGMGWQLLEAVYKRDYILVEGCALVIALFYVLVNLAVDILYSFLDPRVRYV